MTAFNPARPAQGGLGRAQLVAAIESGSISTETDWVEWKSEVDLTNKAWHGEIATHILGLSNRDPERARRTVGGFGYLVLGLDTGRIIGVPAVDPADLEAQISRFSGGADGPRWEPFRVPVGGVEVLVIEVTPPGRGDPIYPLRRTFMDPTGKTVPEGAVFVRKTGRTERAGAADIDMLNRRGAHPGGAELLVTLDWWDHPQAVPAVAVSGDVAQTWIQRERARLLGALEKARYPHAPLALAALSAFGEDREPEEYERQVEEYMAAAAEHLPDLIHERAVAAGIGRLTFAVVNETDHNFEQVAVELYIPGDAAAFFDQDEAADVNHYPAAPRRWGTARSFYPDLGSFAMPTVASLAPRRGRIDNAASARIQFSPLHLRPGHTHALPSVHLVASPPASGGPLVADWHATATNVSGTASGSFEIPFAPQAVDVLRLLIPPEPESEPDE